MKRLIPYFVIFLLTLIYFGCRKDEDPVPVVDTTPPTAIEDVKNNFVLNKDKTVIDTLKLSWEPSVDAFGPVKYVVNLMMYDDSGEAKKIRSIETNEASASFPTLSNSKEYKIEVQAIDSRGNSSNSFLKDLSIGRGLRSQLVSSGILFTWDNKYNTHEKVGQSISIFQYENDKPEIRTEVRTAIVKENKYTFTRYDRSKNYYVKLVINNEVQKTIEKKELNIIADSYNTKITDIVYNREVDTENASLVKSLNFTWKHSTPDQVSNTEYFLELYKIESNDVSTKIKTITTNEKQASFKDLSNIDSYEVKLFFQNTVGNSIQPKSREEIVTISSLKTNSVYDIQVKKELNPNDKRTYQNLTIEWKHNAPEGANLIEYTLNLYELNNSSTPVLKNTNTTFNTMYFYSGISAEKVYQIEIIASVLNHPTTQYLSSDGTKKTISILYRPVENLTYKRYYGTILLNWNHNTQISNPKYKIEVYADSWWYSTVNGGESRWEEITLLTETTTSDNNARITITDEILKQHHLLGEFIYNDFFCTVTVLDSDNNLGQSATTPHINRIEIPKVSDVTSLPSGNSITVKWKNNIPLNEFEKIEIIYFKETQSGNKTNITTTQSEHTFTGLQTGKYLFNIYAYNKEGFKSHVFQITGEILPIGTYYDDIILSTQNDVDNFIGHQIHTVEGNIIINSSTLDLSPLKGIINIKGNLSLKGNFNHGSTSSKDGLNNIESITGDLQILSPMYSGDFSEFNNLKSVNNLEIKNSIVQQTQGFQSLQSVKDITITDNKNMITLPSFGSIKSISSIEIGRNQALTKINGFNELLGINSSLTIYDNTSLSQVSGFDKLRFISKDVKVDKQNNVTLSLAGFGSLEEVENITITNSNLSAIPIFNSLRTVFTDLKIENNRGDFSLNQNFTNLTAINNTLVINNNVGLKSIIDFKALTQTQEIKITNNEELVQLNIESPNKNTFSITKINNPKLVTD